MLQLLVAQASCGVDLLSPLSCDMERRILASFYPSSLEMAQPWEPRGSGKRPAAVTCPLWNPLPSSATCFPAAQPHGAAGAGRCRQKPVPRPAAASPGAESL